ncbi:carbohydrate binding [Dermatophagoides farinae]|uniref:Galectin n=1 Tax=Dermatophagoides farinae TaxID=6954 RepID=A0A922HZE3_DERFA|nr:carbohydrate binding [Dermatophagoides farinae]
MALLDNLKLVEIIDRTRLISDVPQPTLPACCPMPNGGHLRPGSLITVYATCPSNQGRFRIDLYASNCQHCRSNDDGKTSLYDPNKRIVALHFNARFGEALDGSSYIVMNSFHQGKWDQDERSTVFPFQPEQSFCIMILTEEDRFRIYVDGGEQPHYQFKHRFPISDIGRIHVEGPNLTVELIEFREPGIEPSQSLSSSDAIKPSDDDNNIVRKTRDVMVTTTTTNVALSIPFFEHNTNLEKPCDIYINGMIMDPFNKYFVINLAHTGGDCEMKKQNIPIHISIRVDQSKIVRNSLINGEWGQEETNMEGSFPFTIGSMFEICIKNRLESVSIIINGQSCFEYNHRHDPKTIDTLEINGSVRLDSISYRFD